MGAVARVRLGAASGGARWPPVFNVKLATAILDNVNACLKYDDQVCVGGDPNQAPHCSIMPLTIPRMNTASKLGPHTQTDRGTCPGVGL